MEDQNFHFARQAQSLNQPCVPPIVHAQPVSSEMSELLPTELNQPNSAEGAKIKLRNFTLN